MCASPKVGSAKSNIAKVSLTGGRRTWCSANRKKNKRCTVSRLWLYYQMARLPPDLLDIILSFHMTVVAQEFAGNPHYTLYWCYDKGALRQLLGMTHDQYREVQSSMGKFMRRIPRTSHWLTQVSSGWAFDSRRDQGPLGPGDQRLRRAPRPDEAAARRQISQKSYVGLPAPEIKHYTGV